MAQIDSNAVIARFQHECSQLLTRCVLAEAAHAQALERIAELERGDDA